MGLINHYYYFRIRQEMGAANFHAKLAWLAPRDPGFVEDISGAAILKSSSHQAEAQKFLAFLDSPAGQRVIAHSASFEYPLAPGVAPNPQLPPVSSLHPNPITPAQIGTADRRPRACSSRPGCCEPRRSTGRRGAARHASRRSGSGTRRRAAVTDRPLLVLATLVALAVLSPLLLVALQAQHAGWHELTTVLWRARSAMLLKNTVVLAAIVAVLAAALGTGAAWLTERGAVPGRRLWAVLLVMPVAIPDFVVGYAWHSIAPEPGAAARRHAGDDARYLSARLPPGRGRAAPARPSARGDRTDARHVAPGARSRGSCCRCCGSRSSAARCSSC